MTLFLTVWLMMFVFFLVVFWVFGKAWVRIFVVGPTPSCVHVLDPRLRIPWTSLRTDLSL